MSKVTAADKTPPDETTPDQSMTKEQAAKYVTRQVPKQDKDGKWVLDKNQQPVLESVPVEAASIIGWKDYGDHVIVVTEQGEKLRGDKK